MQDVIERIRFVVLVFRLVAWPLAILSVPCGVTGALAVLWAGIVEPSMLTPELLLGSALVLPITYLPVYALRIATRIKRGDRSAQTPATALCCVGMLIGFPVSVVIGLILMHRLDNYFEPYCRYLEGPEPTGWRSRSEMAAA